MGKKCIEAETSLICKMEEVDLWEKFPLKQNVHSQRAAPREHWWSFSLAIIQEVYSRHNPLYAATPEEFKEWTFLPNCYQYLGHDIDIGHEGLDKIKKKKKIFKRVL